MSKKIDVFRAVMVQPQTVSQYLIVIPTLSAFTVLAEAATFPAIKLGEVAIPFKGEAIYRPTVPEINEWRVRVPENYLGLVKQDIVAHHAQVARTSGVMINSLGSVYVYVCNGTDIPIAGVKLINAWIRGRESVDLKYDSPTEVFKWNVVFRYDAIEELITLPKIQQQII